MHRLAYFVENVNWTLYYFNVQRHIRELLWNPSISKSFVQYKKLSNKIKMCYVKY